MVLSPQHVARLGEQVLSGIDVERLAAGGPAFGQEQRGVGQFLRVGQALEQVHPPAGLMLFLTLVEAGHHRAGGEAIYAGFRVLLCHRQHGHGGGKGLLGHRVAEEIRIGVEQLLIQQLDHPLAPFRPGLGQESLGHAGGGFGVDRDRLGKDRRVNGRAIVIAEHGSAIDQHPPVIQPRRHIGHHRQCRFAIEQVALNHFRRWQRGRQRMGRVGRMVRVDHHMPASIGKAARQHCADALASASNENGRGHRDCPMHTRPRSAKG